MYAPVVMFLTVGNSKMKMCSCHPKTGNGSTYSEWYPQTVNIRGSTPRIPLQEECSQSGLTIFLKQSSNQLLLSLTMLPYTAKERLPRELQNGRKEVSISFIFPLILRISTLRKRSGVFSKECGSNHIIIAAGVYFTRPPVKYWIASEKNMLSTFLMLLDSVFIICMTT